MSHNISWERDVAKKKYSGLDLNGGAISLRVILGKASMGAGEEVVLMVQHCDITMAEVTAS